MVRKSTGRHEHGVDGREPIGSSSHFRDGHRRNQKFATNSAPFYGHQHGDVCVRSSKHGLRVRVGEASNPGPQSQRRRFPSQDDGEPDAFFAEPPFASEELLDAKTTNLTDG